MFSRPMLENALRPTPVHNAGHELPELAEKTGKMRPDAA
jgi:hypothetical protein